MFKLPLFIPAVAIIFILYFQYLDFIFQGKKEKYRIDSNNKSRPGLREYIFSALNLSFFAIIGFFLEQAIREGKTAVYNGPVSDVKGFAYAVFSFFLALGIHDVYFYITHRLLHVKFFFKWIHARHHYSHNPNAWSALSFHPAEGLIQISILPLVAFIFPMHEFVLYLFTAFMLFITIYGHTGYELRANRWKGFSIFNTSLHHFQHHQFVNYNFGFYLNIWDRLLKSNYPGYDTDLRAIADKTRPKRNQTT